MAFQTELEHDARPIRGKVEPERTIVFNALDCASMARSPVESYLALEVARRNCDVDEVTKEIVAVMTTQDPKERMVAIRKTRDLALYFAYRNAIPASLCMHCDNMLLSVDNMFTAAETEQFIRALRADTVRSDLDKFTNPMFLNLSSGLITEFYKSFRKIIEAMDYRLDPQYIVDRIQVALFKPELDDRAATLFRNVYFDLAK